MKNAALVGHARRSAVLAKEIATHLALPEDEQRICEAAALLMDSGILGYPDSLVKNKSKKWMPPSRRSGRNIPFWRRPASSGLSVWSRSDRSSDPIMNILTAMDFRTD
ncbi:MAG: hypothetical protein MPW15_19525 [Candidatus Manganitrophus sp.]|nr:hypothetical protein [Candidatus Manganitrophus sp.]